MGAGAAFWVRDEVRVNTKRQWGVNPRAPRPCRPCSSRGGAAIAGCLPLRTACCALVAFTIVPLSARAIQGSAQDDPDALSTLLHSVPAESAKERAALENHLDALSQEAMFRLCGMLEAPGKGDDTQVRYLINALTFRAGAVGQEELRGRLVAAMTQVLEGDAPVAVKAFLIEQLRLVAPPEGEGESAVVQHLAALISEPALTDPIARVLTTIRGGAASQALRAALLDLDGPQRIDVIQALGVTQDMGAIEPLAAELAADDADRRAAAMSALAEIGAPQVAGPILQSLHVQDWFQHNQNAATGLRLAARLQELGEPDLAVGVLRRIDQAHLQSEFVHIRSAALQGLGEALAAGAVDEVLRAIGGDNAEYRAAASRVATELNGVGVTDSFVEQLDSSDARTRATVLDILRQRSDAAALPAVVQALEDKDESVRIAAIGTAAALGGERVVGLLTPMLDRDSPDERAAAAKALVAMPPAASAQIARAIETASPRLKSELLGVLARRGAADQLSVILPELNHDTAAVRIAAARAVGALAGSDAIPRLLAALRRDAIDDPERSAIETALIETAHRTPESQQRGQAIVEAINPDAPAAYASLLRVLGVLGSPACLDAITTATRDARGEIRDAAYRALLQWPSGADAPRVLELAASATDLTHHVIAVRAFTRLVDMADGLSLSEKLGLYQQGFAAARRNEEKRSLLSKMGGLGSPAICILEPYLEDDELRSEAASALLTVAESMLPAGWADARRTVELVRQSIGDHRRSAGANGGASGQGGAAGGAASAEPSAGGPAADRATAAVRERAEKLSERISEYEGFITEWLVAGPYSVAGKAGNEIFDTPFPPEQRISAVERASVPASESHMTADSVEWRPQPAGGSGEDYWLIDLNRSIAGDNRAGYLRTYIHSSKAQPARLELGSDDGIKAWLNGEVVHANNALRGVRRGEDVVSVTLREGWNELLLKVTNNGGGFAACARIRDPEGGALGGIRVSTRPE